MEIGFQPTGTADSVPFAKEPRIGALLRPPLLPRSLSLSRLSRQVKVPCRNKNDRFPPVAAMYFYS